MPRTPEGKVKAALKKMFKQYEPELYYFMPVQTGYGAAGLDFHCHYRGRAFFVETKAPTNSRLTPRQEVLIRRLQEAKAPVFVVYDQEGIKEVETWILKIMLLTTD